VATASEGCVTDEYDGEAMRNRIKELEDELEKAKGN